MLEHLSEVVLISGANLKIYFSIKNILPYFDHRTSQENTFFIRKRSYHRSTEKMSIGEKIQ